MEAQEQHGGGVLGVAAGVVLSIGRGIASVFQAVTRDGTIAAFGRQGASEIGLALKAFPESVQVHEAGTILSPTQGEIAAAREPDGPSPSEIARDDTPYQVNSEQTYNHDLGRGRGR